MTHPQSGPKLPCVVCGEPCPQINRRVNRVCSACRKTPEGMRELGRLANERRWAHARAVIVAGSETLPQEDAFTPLIGEAIIKEWQRWG